MATRQEMLAKVNFLLEHFAANPASELEVRMREHFAPLTLEDIKSELEAQVAAGIEIDEDIT